MSIFSVVNDRFDIIGASKVSLQAEAYKSCQRDWLYDSISTLIFRRKDGILDIESKILYAWTRMPDPILCPMASIVFQYFAPLLKMSKIQDIW